VVALGYGGLSFFSPKPDPLAGLALSTVGRGDIEDAVLAQGTLEASELVSVGAQVSGIVKTVTVTLGQDVTAGDLIAEIDPTDKENAVRSAEAAMASLEAQRTARLADRDKNQRALDRAKRLQGNAVISDAALETAQNTLDASETQIAIIDAQIMQANVQLENAKVDLSRTRIVAPVSGTVVAVLADVGQTLSAQASAPTVIKIANLDTMRIRTRISEADVTRVKPGQRVHFTVLGALNRPIEARLTSIDPAPRSLSNGASSSASVTEAVYYDGLIDVPNLDRALRISMTAQVSIVLSESKKALLVPASALSRSGPETYTVMLVGPDDVPVAHEVKVGINNKVLAEILEGLTEGDRVVGGAGLAGSPSPRPGGFSSRSGRPGMGVPPRAGG
jgi:macrolide-specific efflux system membrane fusion protein